MDVATALQERRAVKVYDPAHRLTEDEIHQLLSAAMLSPTSFNIQHWRFLVVTDPAVRRDLRAAAWDQAQVTDASCVIVLCADTKAWEKNPRHYFRNAPVAVQDMLLPMIENFYMGKEQLQRDEAMRSSGIAAQSLMLMAAHMGYQSCPMIGFDADRVAQIINLPSDHVIGLMIAVGKGLEPARPRSGPLDYSDAVFRDRFAA